MEENTDTGDEKLENFINNESEKPSDEIDPSAKLDNLTLKQQTENMETHAHHLHKAPGNNFWHFFFEFLMLFLAVFCGFLAENLREHYVENERAKGLAKNLYREIFADSINIRQKIGIRNKKESECAYFISYVKDSSLMEVYIRPFSLKFFDFNWYEAFVQQGNSDLYTALNQKVIASVKGKIPNLDKFNRKEAENLAYYYLLILRGTRIDSYAEYATINHELLKILRKEYHLE